MPAASRPTRTYATGAVTRALRVLGLAAAAAVAAWLLVLYPALPDTVPTHFDAAGRADDWGDKSSILWLIVVMLALTALLAWLSTKPRWANYPTQVTEQNAQAIYREGERMLVWMQWPIVLLFAGIALSTVGLAGGALLAAGLVGMIAVLVVGIGRLLRAAR